MAEKRHGRGRPEVIVPLLAAVVFTAALVPASVRADRENPALQPPLLAGVAPLMLATDAELERQLLEKYKPVMYLRLQDRECDRSGEAYDPTTVDVMAGGDPEMLLRTELRDPGLAGPEVSDLAGLGSEYFIDTPGNPKRPGCVYERDWKRFAEGRTPTIYGRVATEEGREGLALQYWFFWYFNDWNNTHEGDWEMAAVVFEESTPEGALQSEPSFVRYNQHGSGERHGWDDDVLVKEDGRPVVYPSAGSHASYFRPEVYVALGESNSGFGCDNATGPHRRVDPELAVIPQTVDAGDTANAWLTFEGRWGERRNWEFNGPTGPNMKRAWLTPISQAEDARGGAFVMPGHDFLGGNSVRTICSTIEAGSRALRAFFEAPALIGGAFAIVAGSIAIGSLVVARDAARRPQLDVTAGFLARRRGIGETLRAATVIYRRNFVVFFGISVVFIPFGVVAAAAQGWLLSVPPIEWLTWLLDRSETAELTVALLIGGLESLAVFIFVLSGANAAAKAIDEGRRPTILSSYRAGLARARAFVPARLWSIVVIGALGLTIVGVPLAFYFAVRLWFVEEATVLDDEGARSALGSSADAVDGHWWRAARAIAFFGLMGALAGPLLAFGLLLWSPLGPEWVNAIAALFHAAVLPFTALGLCMTFRSLQMWDDEGVASRASADEARQAGGWLRQAYRSTSRAFHAVRNTLEGRRPR